MFKKLLSLFLSFLILWSVISVNAQEKIDVPKTSITREDYKKDWYLHIDWWIVDPYGKECIKDPTEIMLSYKWDLIWRFGVTKRVDYKEEEITPYIFWIFDIPLPTPIQLGDFHLYSPENNVSYSLSMFQNQSELVEYEHSNWEWKNYVFFHDLTLICDTKEYDEKRADLIDKSTWKLSKIEAFVVTVLDEETWEEINWWEGVVKDKNNLGRPYKALSYEEESDGIVFYQNNAPSTYSRVWREFFVDWIWLDYMISVVRKWYYPITQEFKLNPDDKLTKIEIKMKKLPPNVTDNIHKGVLDYIWLDKDNEDQNTNSQNDKDKEDSDKNKTDWKDLDPSGRKIYHNKTSESWQEARKVIIRSLQDSRNLESKYVIKMDGNEIEWNQEFYTTAKKVYIAVIKKWESSALSFQEYDVKDIIEVDLPSTFLWYLILIIVWIITLWIWLIWLFVFKKKKKEERK